LAGDKVIGTEIQKPVPEASAQTIPADATGAAANSPIDSPVQAKEATQTPGQEQAPQQQAQAKAPPLTAKEAREFTSAGKRIHSEITYRGIDWLVNSAIGVSFAYWASRTKSGEKYFNKPVSGFFQKVLKPFLKTPTATEEGAKWGTMFAGIMAGGTVIIPPLMVMENKKVKKSIVRWLDEKIYGKEAVESDPKFAEVYHAIDDEPRKGFAIGMASRLIAIAPLIAAASIPATNKPLIKYLYDPIGKGTKWLAAKVGIKPGRMAIEGAMEHIEGDPNIAKKFQSNWDFLHRTIGFDFGLTIFYSIFHQIAYNSLAAMGMKKEDTTPHSSRLRDVLEDTLQHDPLLVNEDRYTPPIPPHTHPAPGEKQFTSAITRKNPLDAALDKGKAPTDSFASKISAEEMAKEGQALDRTPL
jgi:hypothetical protein